MADENNIKQEWEIYWSKNKKAGGAVYDFVAGVYRKLVLKNILAYFVKKYFAKGQKALHAGCGSGQVDTEISGFMDITAIDISPTALDIYRSVNGPGSKTVQGNIFNLPFPDESFDSLYNLGVMEHFTTAEIGQILQEFKRVLKPGGRMIIFWPPVFGTTVQVLDFTHFFFNKLLRRKIQLHPAEISRLRSKKDAVSYFERSGFEVVRYYFGVRDLFTQCVIVAQKNK